MFKLFPCVFLCVSFLAHGYYFHIFFNRFINMRRGQDLRFHFKPQILEHRRGDVFPFRFRFHIRYLLFIIINPTK